MNKTNVNHSIEETYNKVLSKAIENMGSCDIIGIDQDHSVAFLPCSQNSPIKNCFIVAQNNEELHEWQIDNYKIELTPFNMQMVIDPEKAVALKYIDGEESKYILMKTDTEFVKSRIFGAIETNNDFVAFNAENGNVHYIYKKHYVPDIPIYQLFKSFKDWTYDKMEVNNDEQQ